MKSAFSYRVYGLVVRSQIELPELPACPPDLEPDLLIRLGGVPEHLEEVQHRQSYWLEANARECLIAVFGLCRLHVREGREITVDIATDGHAGQPARAADMRLFLLGSGMGAVLHQRGCLPLHVGAVRAAGKVWAFTGPSGAGKSTLTATLHLRYGLPLVSDDVMALHLPPGQPPQVFPGPRKLKLWQDAAAHLRCDPGRLVQDLSNTPKFQLYLDDDAADAGPEPLHALVLLESSPEPVAPRLEKLSGACAFDACLTALYRPYMAYWYRNRQAVMADLLALCSRVEIHRFRRHWSLDAMDAQLLPLLEAMDVADACIGQEVSP